MLAKILSTIFLVLGLTMVGLAFFYNYELKEQQAAGQEQKPSSPFMEMDTYTLVNEQYEGLSSPQVEFQLMHVTEGPVVLEEQPRRGTAVSAYANEFELLEKKEEKEASGKDRLPLLLGCAGALFLFFGFFSCRRSFPAVEK